MERCSQQGGLQPEGGLQRVLPCFLANELFHKLSICLYRSCPYACKAPFVAVNVSEKIEQLSLRADGSTTYELLFGRCQLE